MGGVTSARVNFFERKIVVGVLPGYTPLTWIYVSVAEAISWIYKFVEEKLFQDGVYPGYTPPTWISMSVVEAISWICIVSENSIPQFTPCLL